MYCWKQFVIIITLTLGIYAQSFSQTPHWPATTTEMKPWTRWWWHGSAVTKSGITSELVKLKKAGIGGVEITPIFGVKGTEKQFIDFLSPRWVDMLLHTLAEAKRLELGVDMATGTGWPFGGPWISQEQAPKTIFYKKYTLQTGETLVEPVTYTQEPLLRTVRGQLSIEQVKNPISANDDLQALAIDQIRFMKELPLITIMAYNQEGTSLDLTDYVNNNNKLDWKAPKGVWELYAIFQGDHGKMVERAAPGGEGNVIDHFSKNALATYLAKFDSAFKGTDISSLRAFFNDSYEVDDARGEANWTPGFFDTFQELNHYDLRLYLPQLLEKSDIDIHRRVLTDFRVTIAHLLHQNFTLEWRKWAHEQGVKIRNQAHGSPANILDLYAAVDIPETEGTDILKIKFASSAANVTGKHLSSSESATWLKDHFLSSLSDVKQNLERYFLGGINHVFYHGTAYSPDEAPWPGWLFYAAIHANDRNTWWRDFPALNTYVTRVQSKLQTTSPDNDLLVYFPVHDRYATPGHGLLEHFDIRGNFYESEVKKVGEELWSKGYSFDFISDQQISELTVDNGNLTSYGNTYQAVLIPATTYMPEETLKKLLELKQQGIKILFHKKLPDTVPGLSNLAARTADFEKWKSALAALTTPAPSLEKLLSHAKIIREPMTDMGVSFNRKKSKEGYSYYIINHSTHTLDGYIPLAKAQPYAHILNPMNGTTGITHVNNNKVYVQLQPGESLFITTSQVPTGRKYFNFYEEKDTPISLADKWKLIFTEGGPTLPSSRQGYTLGSWTSLDTEAAAFSGTGTYITSFKRPKGKFDALELDLGEVYHSATIFINGQNAGTLIGPEYKLLIPVKMLTKTNELKIEVTNLMANRIIDMDKKNIPYRKFYNINFPAHNRENSKGGLFHADHWEPLPSGLLGPVTVRPMMIKTFK